MFLVEIALPDADRLVETVETMRAWLTQHRLTPVNFGYSLTSSRTLFRVDFATEAQAVTFVGAFGGIIIDRPPQQRSA
jgi:hypothetical protein